MENDPNNANAPATKADLAEAVAATKGEFKELFNTQKEEMERLLADQANVILEAVDERMDKKLNEKFDPVMTKLDGIMKGVEALQQENTVGTEQNSVGTQTNWRSTRPASQSWRPHRHPHKSFSPYARQEVRQLQKRNQERER